MPKAVDHDQRRADLADAAVAIIQREGVAAVSVRRVAAEAGVSPGAVRHYFPAHSELLAHTLVLMAQAIAGRVDQRMVRRPEDVTGMLCEVLPMDDTQTTEFEVWLQLISVSRTDEALRVPLHRLNEGVGHVCHWAVYQTLPGASAADLQRLSIELRALIDGLGVHLVLGSPGVTPTSARRTVRDWLKRLARG